jgi:type IV pilus assembly protein PilW
MTRLVTNRKGFTIVELLVAMALTGLVAAAIYKAFGSQQKVYSMQDQAAEIQQDMRAAMEVMVTELRMAGYDPTRAGYDPKIEAGAGFKSATSSSLVFTADLNRNAKVFPADLVSPAGPDDATSATDPGEWISYALSTDANSDGIADNENSLGLGRKVWSGALQPIAENIEAINFVYLDGNGVVIPTPVAASDLENIRSVEITMVARTSRRDKEYTNNTAYRNQSHPPDPDPPGITGITIRPAPGDNYRRRLLTTTVNCRNMGLQ